MDKEKKRAIAQLVYSDVMEAVRQWEEDPSADVDVGWAGVVCIDGECFMPEDLE